MSDDLPEPSGSILLYQTEDGRNRVECRMADETLWLSLNQIATLFDRDKSVISKHLKNIFEEGEIVRDSVVARNATTAADGKTYQVEYYQLEAVLAVGFRIRSPRGTQFRQWATAQLQEYLTQGFIMDDERMKNPDQSVYPADLNDWEIEFAKVLDNDPSGTVLWWHRNPPRKKYSVAIVRPDGGRFFPDFIVGVKGRTVAKDGILLIETKHAIGSVDSKIKSVIEHKDYGRALMIHWKDWHDPKNRVAMTVVYDPVSDKNVLDAVFRCGAMPTY